MKQITISEFLDMGDTDIAASPCVEVLSDADDDGNGGGELLFAAMIQPEGNMRDRLVGIASQIDSSRAR
jgi:hypothetical protein